MRPSGPKYAPRILRVNPKKHGFRIRSAQVLSPPPDGTGVQALSEPNRQKHFARLAERRLRLLLIDDERPLLRAMKRLLNRHDVTAFSSGREAIETLEQGAVYDAVLCDLIMPGVTGIHVHRWLQENRPELCQRLAICTGGALSPAADAFIASNAVTILEKPVDIDELRQRIAAWQALPPLCAGADQATPPLR